MNGWRHLGCLALAALAAGLRADDRPADEPAKSGNWLVDAMSEKSPAAPGDAKASARPGDTGPLARSAGPHPDDGTANPLSSYLSTWMTPHDLEVLKLKAPDTNAGGLYVPDGSNPQGPARTRAARQENPYLASLAPPAPVPAKGAQSPPATPAPAPVSLATKTDAAPAKTPGPPGEVIKAQDDAKYFPQLKRF